MNDGDRFFFIDTETTGLLPNLGVILEVGIRIVDADLQLIDEYDTVFWDTERYDTIYAGLIKQAEGGGDRYVLDMHEKSGLWTQASSYGQTVNNGGQELIDFVMGHGIDPKVDPMCGSSVQFDREWLTLHMPSLAALFHYRNVDTSTLKEICRRMNPPVYAKLDEMTSPKKKHRVMPDLDDTIEEFRFYRDNFLWVAA